MVLAFAGDSTMTSFFCSGTALLYSCATIHTGSWCVLEGSLYESGRAVAWRAPLTPADRRVSVPRYPTPRPGPIPSRIREAPSRMQVPRTAPIRGRDAGRDLARDTRRRPRSPHRRPPGQPSCRPHRSPAGAPREPIPRSSMRDHRDRCRRQDGEREDGPRAPVAAHRPPASAHASPTAARPKSPGQPRGRRRDPRTDQVAARSIG